MSKPNQPIRLLHFADAHIDMANYGRHDPASGLPVRVIDFLQALDQIVETAISENVDLVIFAGDAYKDRNPQPTFQRAWGERIMRLSAAGIPTLMLVGNHDVAPATGRAHTIQEFHTLQVPHVHVADRIHRFDAESLGLPLQIITIPWVSRSALMTREETAGKPLEEVLTLVEEKVSNAITQLIDEAEPNLPLLLVAHASIQGAKYGSERMVMLGHELVLSGSIVRDRRLDYVALGHIHKHQSLNDGLHPPIIYPGSIERIDFGEAGETKGFVMVTVSKGQTAWDFIPLETRPFVDVALITESADSFMTDILENLPSPEKIEGAICRLQLTYPRDWEPLLDESAINDHFKEALSFHIQKHRQHVDRVRLGETAAIESLSPDALLAKYWQTQGLEEEETTTLQELAKEIFATVDDDSNQA